MADKFKCPFCGSDKLFIPTGFVVGTGLNADEYAPEKKYCCDSQKKNAEFIKKNYDPDHAPDDVSKL